MLIREERVSCSCGEVLVVEYQERQPPGESASGTVVEFSCPRCARPGTLKLHSPAAKFIVRRATDTPVFPRLRLPDA